VTVDLLLAGLCLGLLACSAFFSSAETALFALGAQQRHELALREDAAARRVTRLLHELSSVLITILIGSTLVNITLAALAARLILKRLSGPSGPLVSLVGVTAVLVVFAEILPKSVAVGSPLRISLRLSGPLLRVESLLAVPTALLRRLSRRLLRDLERLLPGDSLELRGEEMLALLSLGEESGSLRARERQLVEGVFELGDLRVEALMTPRVDLFLLEAMTSVEAAAAAMRRAGHSFAPVYRESSDNVIGVVSALALLAESDLARPVNELVEPVEFCPESRKADSLLIELLAKDASLAVVLDEYGALAGLIGVDDLFAVVVGRLREQSKDELHYRLLDPSTLIASSRLPVARLPELLGLRLPPGSAETLGGYLMEKLGEVPETGRAYVLDELVWTVLSARGPALGTLRLETLQAQARKAERERRP
jgi:CBS domain containing-hemolysin-like protein